MPWWGEGQSAEQGTDQNAGQPQDLGRTLRLKVPAHSVALRDLCSRKVKEALMHTKYILFCKKRIFSKQ